MTTDTKLNPLARMANDRRKSICPGSGIDATRVSHRSQAAVLRAIRGVVFSAKNHCSFLHVGRN